MKLINKKKVFSYIYTNKETSKHNIASDLNMSLPTVSQNLNELLDGGLIQKNGYYESTGGRRSQIISCCPYAKIALGVEIIRETAQIVALDLYGNLIKQEECPVSFNNQEHTPQEISLWINSFIDALPYSKDSILGIQIAVQGLVSGDGTKIIYDSLLKGNNLSYNAIQKSISYPCYLTHDTDASAFAELWKREQLSDIVCLFLNRNFGGAVTINGRIHIGKNSTCSVLEHMCLVPNGKDCYCGNKGCIEAYCSVNSLLAEAGEKIDIFFENLRSGKIREQTIWNTYLENLARAISNIRTLLDCDFIISGYLLPYLRLEDFSYLEKLINENCPFEFSEIKLLRGLYGPHSASIGAALLLVYKFLQENIE